MTYNLLIIDDEVHSRNTLCNCFPWEQIGFKVIGQADNGKDALAFIKRNNVHVLLCDIQMPVMNGIDLVKILYTWDNLDDCLCYIIDSFKGLEDEYSI